jgi:hypothetical protein
MVGNTSQGVMICTRELKILDNSGAKLLFMSIEAIEHPGDVMPQAPGNHHPSQGKGAVGRRGVL